MKAENNRIQYHNFYERYFLKNYADVIELAKQI
jgi:hypothetical protein